MDNMAAGWDRPQEDEFALLTMGLPSPYRRIAFPNNAPVDIDYLNFEGVPEEEIERWLGCLRSFLQAVSVRAIGNAANKVVRSFIMRAMIPMQSRDWYPINNVRFSANYVNVLDGNTLADGELGGDTDTGLAEDAEYFVFRGQWYF